MLGAIRDTESSVLASSPCRERKAIGFLLNEAATLLRLLISDGATYTRRSQMAKWYTIDIEEPSCPPSEGNTAAERR